MATILPRRTSHAQWDGLLIALAFVHGGLLLTRPSALLVAVGLWWNANTISHNFIHRRFFRSHAANALFSFYLTILLGFPQSLWRAKHLAHHGVRDRSKLKLEPLEVAAVVLLWAAILVFAREAAVSVYAPGFAIGLALCFLQGHYEHARGTTSHYSSLYNLLLFNDGYHVEHHLHPGVHWRELPSEKIAEAKTSRWPAILRWLECVNLCALERLVLRSSALRRIVVDRHERAFCRLNFDRASVRSVGIVGGGLFPRTAIILRRLMPQARLTIVEMNLDNIAVSRRFIDSELEYLVERFDPSASRDFDLLVIPLAFVGSREAVYRDPPARFVLVHDWIWRRRGESTIVSLLLLKRLNMVKR